MTKRCSKKVPIFYTAISLLISESGSTNLKEPVDVFFRELALAQ
jgi:hypothetical protein